MHPSTPEPQHRRTALVTGASSGIGEAFAGVFAGEGFDVVLVARREDRLRTLAERLSAAHGVRAEVIVADLGQPDAVRDLCDTLDARGLRIDALVNNAGYGVPGTFLASDWPRHAAMLQLMVTAVCELTHRLLPGMLARRYGRIVNVASVAGLVPAPAGHTLYAATKSFLIKYSESLANETRGTGVHVTALCPGFTFSEFHDVTGTRERMNRLPRWLWMDSPAVARQGYDAVMSGTPILINGAVNKTIAALVGFTPAPIVKAIERRLGHRKVE